MSAGLAHVIVGVVLPTVNGSVAPVMLPKFVPPMVAAVKEAPTLWVETGSADGLYVENVATPPVPVIAEPAAPPSTAKLIVAPTTPALLSFRVSVAVNVTGPVDPNVTEFGLTLFTTRVVGTVAVTVNELEAVLPVKLTPPEFAVTAPVVLFLVPGSAAVTFPDRRPEPFAGIVPPLKLTVVAPAAAENVPPHVLVAEGVDAT